MLDGGPQFGQIPAQSGFLGAVPNAQQPWDYDGGQNADNCDDEQHLDQSEAGPSNSLSLHVSTTWRFRQTVPGAARRRRHIGSRRTRDAVSDQ
jgi:hypothetical protein